MNSELRKEPMETEKQTPLASWYARLREWLKEPIQRGTSIPPYILIAVLWVLSGRSDDRARERDAFESDVRAALIQYQVADDSYDNAWALRNNCITRVDNRNNNITNWHDLYDFIRTQPNGEVLAGKLQEDFDNKPSNQELSIEKDCAQFPEPNPVVIPPILIEQGLIRP